MVGIDERGHVWLQHALDVHGDIRKVRHVGASLQHRPFFEKEMCARFEEKRSGQPYPLGDDHRPALGGCGIDSPLDGFCLHQGAVIHRPEGGDDETKDYQQWAHNNRFY